jgi:hypothetical protein
VRLDEGLISGGVRLYIFISKIYLFDNYLGIRNNVSVKAKEHVLLH